MAKGKKYPGVYLVDPNGDKNGPWFWRIRQKINGVDVRDEKRRDPSGKRFEKAEDAWNDRCRAMNEYIQNGGGYGKINDITFGDVYTDFVNSPKAEEKSMGTLRKHDSVWRNHIQPEFEDKKINYTTVDDMYTFILGKYNSEKYKYEYIESFIKFFYLIYGYALSKQWIKYEKYNEMFKNDTSRLKMPARRRDDQENKDIITYTDIQLYQIEQLFLKEDKELYPSYMLARYAGLRKGEIFGLRWSNIDWKNNRINISHQMLRDDGMKLYVLAAPKTKNAYRYVLMPPVLRKYLWELSEQRKAEKQALGNLYRDNELVYDPYTKKPVSGIDFINRRSNGELLTINSTKKIAKIIKKELNIELQYHTFRHTYATMCAVNNVDENMLCEMMGHDKLETTRKYYLDTKNKQLVDRTEELLSKIFEPKLIAIKTINFGEKFESETNIPSPTPFTKSEIAEGAEINEHIIDEIESGKIPSIKVIKKELLSDSKELKLIRYTMGDGAAIVLDVTEADT